MTRARKRDELLAGGPNAPVTLRHLVVAGSNAEIGRAVAELAIERYGIRPEALLSDGRYVRARRTYFQRNYPTHWQRMRGVAAAFGLHAEDDRFDFSILAMSSARECNAHLRGSSTYSPPWTTADAHGHLTRSAAALAGLVELYVMEWRPARSGHASIALHVFDLLSGTLHGINDAGLAVSAVADDEVNGRRSGSAGSDPATVRAVGLHELQLMRFVLDTCASVDQAQAALLGVRDLRIVTAARYLIADRTGRSFEYECGATRSVQRLIDSDAEVQTISPTESSRVEPAGDSSDRQTSCLGARQHEARATWTCTVDQERRSLELTVRPDGSLRRDQRDREPRVGVFDFRIGGAAD